MRKLNLVSLLLCIFAVSILAGCATPILKSSSRAKQYSGGDTSWYGKSGAQPAPVKDLQKGGSWWMPKKAPKGKDSTVWGNKGYVYLAGKMPVEKLVLPDVYFLFDSAELTLPAQKILNANVKALKEHPKAKVILLGYASPEGLENRNLKLSENRALAVKNYLVKNGISKSSILVQAEGEIEVNKSAYPSARKVHFKILSR